MRSSRILWLAAASFCVSAIAAGQPAKDQAGAQALFDEGVRLMAEGKSADACPKLEASLAKFDGIGIRGKLAECYERVGRVASAWAMWREVAVLTKKASDAKRLKIAEERVKALAARVPYLSIEVADAQRVDGLSVSRNGASVEPGAFGVKVAVDPGSQHIEVTAPGKKPWKADVGVAEGESKSIAVPALEAEPETRAEPEREAQVVPAPRPEAPSSSPLRTVGFVALGVGAVGILAGGYFGISASSNWNGAFDDGNCDSATNQCNSKGQTQTEDARSQATLANVFIGGGAVLAATGAALVIWAPSKRETPTASRRVVVAGAPTPAGFGLALDGRF